MCNAGDGRAGAFSAGAGMKRFLPGFLVGLFAGVFLGKLLPVKVLLIGILVLAVLGGGLLFLLHRGFQDFQGY